MSQFQANLKKMPGISHLEALNLLDAEGNVVATIENKAGSQGSLSLYNHLGQTYGAITRMRRGRASNSTPSIPRMRASIRASIRTSTACSKSPRRRRRCASSTCSLFDPFFQ